MYKKLGFYFYYFLLSHSFFSFFYFIKLIINTFFYKTLKKVEKIKKIRYCFFIINKKNFFNNFIYVYNKSRFSIVVLYYKLKYFIFFKILYFF